MTCLQLVRAADVCKKLNLKGSQHDKLGDQTLQSYIYKGGVV